VAGVVLFARTSKAAARLSRQFRERSVDKHYLAVVGGSVSGQADRLIDHIERRDRLSCVVPTPTDCSQEARLRYTVIGRDSGKSLLKVSLETGRRHQIRIQLAHMGHPIIGDLRYGAETPLPERQIALLAHQLTVKHPTRGDRLLLSCPIPQHWPWPDIGRPGSQAPPWDWRAFDPVFR
jgi:23S rRNA pseudouridine1911/1915/1917 synthase